MTLLKTRTIAIMLCWIAAIALQAAPVSLDQAQSAAALFMSQQMRQPISANSLTLATQAQRRASGVNASQAPAYYVFNSTRSFVIIAGDDRMPTVLGYSNSSVFKTNNMPDGLKELLETYAAQAAMLDRATIDSPMPSGSVARAPIAPLLKSKWNQSNPYNLLCPTYDTSGSLCATGCVATAMAQVMYYHKWPTVLTKNIPSYTSMSIGKVMPELSASRFPLWVNLKNTYAASETGVEAQAVASLMLFCGQSLNMDYGPESGASTANIANALTTYFDYAPTAKYVERENYTSEGWSQLIYDELAANRPIVFRGSAFNGGGHSFVCDGADANGLFHFNWGWGGSGDGYFLLTRLNPDDQGVGSIVSNDGYIVGSAAVIGIQPRDPSITYADDLRLTISDLSVPTTTYHRSSANASFTGVQVNGGFWNYTSATRTFGFGYGVFDEAGQLVRTVFTSYFNELPPNYGSGSVRKLTFYSSIKPGTYYVKAICCKDNDKNWEVCQGGETNYLKAEITETSLTLIPMGNAGPCSYTVNDVAYGGILQKGRSIRTVANLTNTGSRDFSYIYLHVNGTPTSVALCDLNPGETGEILMHFTPKTAGTYNIKLSLDENGNDVLYNGSVTINNSVPASIGFSSLAIGHLVNGTSDIRDDKLAYSVTATNKGTTDYNDLIAVRIYRHTTGNYGSLYKTEFFPVNLSAGSSTNITGAFNDLDINESYFLTFSYYNNGTLTNGGGTSFYNILGAGPVEDEFDVCDVNKDGDVDVADINCVLGHMQNNAEADPYNRADVNGDGDVDVADINAILSKLLKK